MAKSDSMILCIRERIVKCQVPCDFEYFETHNFNQQCVAANTCKHTHKEDSECDTIKLSYFDNNTQFTESNAVNGRVIVVRCISKAV